MQKKSRWRAIALGAGVVFILVTIAILLVDPIVKSQIETRGTRAVGARVELAQADVSFFPLGVTLTGLQVTNPDRPMTNALQVDRIKPALEVGPLFKKKIIIEQMAIERVRFNTPRSTSGAVSGLGPDKPSGTAQAGQDCRGLQLPTIGLPDVTTILGTAQLASVSRMEAIQTQIDRQQAEWKNKLGSLPGPETFEGYRQRIEKFTSGGKTSMAGLLGAPAEIQALQKDLQSDLDQLKKAQKVLGSEIDAFKGRFEEVKGLAASDVTALVKQYALTGDNLKNISRALLGDAFCGWLIQAMDWYARIKPLIAGKTGGQEPSTTAGTPAKKEEGSMPAFLIRSAFASVELTSGLISGELKNVTSDQPLFGLPLAFYLSGEKLKGLDQIQINGVLDHVRPEKTQDTLDVVIRGLALENVVIPTGTGLPLTIRRALAELQLKSSLSGETIGAVLHTGLTNAIIDVAQTGAAGPIGDIIASVLQGLKHVDVEAAVKGTLRDYTVNIKSGLDQALAPALSKAVQQQTTVLREQLAAGLDTRMTPAVTRAQKDLAGLGVIQSELVSRLDLGKNLIQNLKRPF
jgi:uncharacterized protein (TIGR03545 family)